MYRVMLRDGRIVEALPHNRKLGRTILIRKVKDTEPGKKLKDVNLIETKYYLSANEGFATVPGEFDE